MDGDRQEIVRLFGRRLDAVAEEGFRVDWMTAMGLVDA